MRGFFSILICTVASFCGIACSDGQVGEACPSELKLVYTAKSEDTFHEWKWIYTTPEGHLVIDTLGFGPQNREVLVYDSCYRLVCIAGQASEVGRLNFVKVIYSKGDMVSGFVSGNLAVLEDSLIKIDSLYGKVGMHMDTQLVMLMRIVSKWNSYDRQYWQRFNLRRDADGEIVEVYDPETKYKIKVQVGCKIRYELKEDRAFWMSDIDGGRVLLHFYVEPKDRDLKQYKVKMYDGYKPVEDVKM